jgi:hypothetical protein
VDAARVSATSSAGLRDGAVQDVAAGCGSFADSSRVSRIGVVLTRGVSRPGALAHGPGRAGRGPRRPGACRRARDRDGLRDGALMNRRIFLIVDYDLSRIAEVRRLRDYVPERIRKRHTGLLDSAQRPVEDAEGVGNVEGKAIRDRPFPAHVHGQIRRPRDLEPLAAHMGGGVAPRTGPDLLGRHSRRRRPPPHRPSAHIARSLECSLPTGATTPRFNRRSSASRARRESRSSPRCPIRAAA